MPVKILLVDDHPVLRLTLRKWLERARDLQVVGEAEAGSPVMALIRLADPDVVIVDVHTSAEAGLNMARVIRDNYPELPIVAIGDAKNGKLRVAASKAGAWAYFPNQRPEEMAKAIRSVIGRKSKQFVDLSKGVSQRPAPESFVGLPDQRPQRKPPEPAPALAPTEAVSQRPAPESFVGLPDERSLPEPPQRPARKLPKRKPSRPAAESFVGLPKEESSPGPPQPAAQKLPTKRSSRPAAESFVGLPDEGSTPPVPELKPDRRSGAARRKTSKPVKKVPNGEVKTDPPAELVAASPERKPLPFDLGMAETTRRKAPRKRKKKDEVLEAVDVRGPTGLPRRFGGHR
jgi:DNA-binding NarL/FixJ family response regulator